MPEGSSSNFAAVPRAADAPAGPELPERLLAKLRITVPGYELLDEIGSGGQGTVYRARELTSGLTVAVKVLNGGADADARSRARLRRETAAMRALNHPNIVCVIESGRTPLGLDYLVMNYVRGRPLDALWEDPAFAAQVALEPPARLRLFKRICDAVQAAHLKGITHRDLAPSNILITDDGEPHVLDFGLASTAFDHLIHPSSGDVSVTGQFIGKVRYAAPEQARAGVGGGGVDIRTDVYALGVILYQILTNGAFPYEVVGNLLDVLNHIVHTRPAPPRNTIFAGWGGGDGSRVRRRRRPGPALVNRTIEAVVLKALEKDPADRYQSAGELAADVEQYLAGAPTLADVRPLESVAGRGPTRAWWVGVAMLLLVGGMIVGLWAHGRGGVRHATNRVAVAPQVAELGGTMPVAPAAVASRATTAVALDLAGVRALLDRPGPTAPRTIDQGDDYLAGARTWEADAGPASIAGTFAVGASRHRAGARSEVPGYLTIGPGFELQGGTLLVAAGTLDLKGTAERPVVCRAVTFLCEAGGAVRAAHVVFEDCWFAESGGTSPDDGGYATHWTVAHCVLHHSNFDALDRAAVGLHVEQSAFVECALPRRAWATRDDPRPDVADLRSDPWNVIERCAFFNCELSPSSVWVTHRCNFFGCSVGPAEDCPSRKGLVIELGLRPADRGLMDELHRKSGAGVAYTAAAGPYLDAGYVR